MIAKPPPVLYTGVLTSSTVLEKQCGNMIVAERNDEEGFLLVAMEEDKEHQSRDTYATAIVITDTSSPWRRVGKSVLGLLMTILVTGAGLTGGWSIYNHFCLVRNYGAAPVLVFDAFFCIFVHTALWTLLGRMHRTLFARRNDETELFVATVMQCSTFWNYVGLVLIVASTAVELLYRFLLATG